MKGLEQWAVTGDNHVRIRPRQGDPPKRFQKDVDFADLHQAAAIKQGATAAGQVVLLAEGFDPFRIDVAEGSVIRFVGKEEFRQIVVQIASKIGPAAGPHGHQAGNGAPAPIEHNAA